MPDVNKFVGHIACSILAKLEIETPIYNNSSYMIGVLDIDRIDLACFHQIDEKYLSQTIKLLTF